MTVQATTPFGIDPVQRVALPMAPLEKVILQVRFPAILSIRDEDRVAPFQEALRHRYPTLRKHQEQSIELSESGVTTKKGMIWRLSDAAKNYQVSLCQDFISLDVGRYESRAEFSARIMEALAALDDAFAPSTYDRIGVRYVARVVDQTFVENIGKFVRPEMLGAALSFPNSGGVSIGEASASPADGFQTTARWGVHPAGAVADPRVLSPKEGVSWFLDIDTYTQAPGDYDVPHIVQIANSCADADYRFFRWAVTDEFLQRFGGDVP